MASTKNVQALNNRLELTCRNRVGEFYRQHISSMAQLEHEKLDTARMLKSVKKCPSNYEALSIKFLGPPPKSGHQQRREHKQAATPTKSRPQGGDSNSSSGGAAPPQEADQPPERRSQQRAPPQTAAPVGENPFAPPPQPQHQPLYPMERAKTFAADTSAATPQRHQRLQDSQHRRRSRTPFPNKLERFYTHLEDTKRSCGIYVVDSTQTSQARRFYGTLTRAEWRAKLAKLDPEYFRNVANEDTESETESHPS